MGISASCGFYFGTTNDFGRVKTLRPPWQYIEHFSAFERTRRATFANGEISLSVNLWAAKGSPVNLYTGFLTR